MKRVYAGAAARFDEHRNTSRALPVSPQAIEAARRSQVEYERTRPEWWRWVTGGQPQLTQAEYDALPTTKARRKRGR